MFDYSELLKILLVSKPCMFVDFTGNHKYFLQTFISTLRNLTIANVKFLFIYLIYEHFGKYSYASCKIDFVSN